MRHQSRHTGHLHRCNFTGSGRIGNADGTNPEKSPAPAIVTRQGTVGDDPGSLTQCQEDRYLYTTASQLKPMIDLYQQLARNTDLS